MIDASPFADGRGRYPDRLTASVPRGFRHVVRDAARRQRVTLSKFVRDALAARLADSPSQEAADARRA